MLSDVSSSQRHLQAGIHPTQNPRALFCGVKELILGLVSRAKPPVASTMLREEQGPRTHSL